MPSKFILLIVIGLSFIGISFMSPGDKAFHTGVVAYYDATLDTLLSSVKEMADVAARKKNRRKLRAHFFACRQQYKKIEFFTDQFNTRGARAINGPDLLRIEEDTHTDSVKPHGFQRIETILYDEDIDYKLLQEELHILTGNIEHLRQEPDHQYYFRNDRVFEALRSGIYNIIAKGITGFDVPASEEALPGVKAELLSMKYVISRYKTEITEADKTLYANTVSAFDNAVAQLDDGSDFNSFNRLHFIKEHLNIISARLQQIAAALGYIRAAQLTPLKPEAPHLFAEDAFDIDFFSPTKRYRMTPQRVSLGKQLFYDTRLSGNNSRSCASCHKPSLAFTDGLPKGLHMDGKRTVLRNTPTLWNSALQTRQFYDSRALVLETQLSAVVHNEDEMGGSLKEAIPGLQADENYNAMFRQAYPQDEDPVTQYTIANAISSYIRSLVSLNSPFDRYIRGQSDTLNKHARRGFNLFMGKAKCGTCHYAPVFNGLVPPRYEEMESEILAVPVSDAAKSHLDADEGKYRHTRVPLHKYAFKTPTVRNAALTAPYMHNGVFRTLTDVVKFYNDGGGAGRGIDLDTQTLPADKLDLDEGEIKDIVAFLQSLTDTTAVH